MHQLATQSDREVLVRTGSGAKVVIQDEQHFELALDSVTKLLTRKGDKFGRDFCNSEDVLKVAKHLSLGSSDFQISPLLLRKLLPAAAIFARWAFRLGHPDAIEVLQQVSADSGDATYFLARIMEKNESIDRNQILRMYNKVERCDCESAYKAKQRILNLKWLESVAALRICLFLLKKRRQRPAQFRTKSFRDLSIVLCEAELKSPYSFCK